MSSNENILIYAIRGTDKWWEYVGKNMESYNSFVVSDIRGKGDFNVVNDFYKSYPYFYENESQSSPLLSTEVVVEIIKRCRVLRSMAPRVANAMVMSMAEAFKIVLEEVNPVVIVAFPIDRYVSDVLHHLAKARGIPFFELAVSPLPRMAMLMSKGVLIKRDESPAISIITDYVSELTKPLFAPSYVEGKSNFGLAKFLRIFFYFKLRGFVFKLISLINRDPLNLHYLDSQSFLPHKVRIGDVKVVSLTDRAWRGKVEYFPVEKRIFFGLTVFPEASIDYWIEPLELIQYEDVVVDAAKSFSQLGYVVVVKDHPQQYGFRKKDFIQRLLEIENVVFVPYHVTGNELLAMCGINFTFTGTLGLQAALLGKTSITVDNYYSVKEDFVHYHNRSEIRELSLELPEDISNEDLKLRQHRVVSNLLRGSFECDFFSFQNFDPKCPSAAADNLGVVLGNELRHHLSRSVRNNLKT